MSDRDPRIDPAAGDVVCSPDIASHIVVDDVSDGVVRCRIRTMGRPDKLTAPLLEDWREIASLCVPREDRLAEMQREQDWCRARLAELEAQMAFHRGAS